MNSEYRDIAQVFHVKLDMAKTLIAFGPHPTTPKGWLENPMVPILPHPKVGWKTQFDRFRVRLSPTCKWRAPSWFGDTGCLKLELNPVLVIGKL